MPPGRHLVGIESVIDLAATDFVRRADELRHPILLIHSLDDEFVPAQRSIDLAAARPDLVQLETWQVARHCKEWNVDQQRWERLVEAFVTQDAAPPAQRVQP